MLHFRDRLGVARRSFTPSQKSRAPQPFLCVNRSPIPYDFRGSAKAIHYSFNLALKSLVSKRKVDDFLKIVYRNLATSKRHRQRFNLMERTQAGGDERVYETSIAALLLVLLKKPWRIKSQNVNGKKKLG